MTRLELIDEIRRKSSYLCIGLDTDIRKIPEHLMEDIDPVFSFNKEIIDHTKDFAVAYKLNTAFYEANGERGWQSMKKTVDYIPGNILRIADAKRGDIGNSSEMYARAFFDEMNFDAITVSPYMGRDSIKPFFERSGKWVIVLGITSNTGAGDFQKKMIDAGKGESRELYKEVLTQFASEGSPENLMFVIGATQPDAFEDIRAILPDHFLLIPGIGAQGGDLENVSQMGLNADCGLLLSVSRSVIYRTSDRNFALEAGKAALVLRNRMKDLLTLY